MAEIFDVYDEQDNWTGTAERGVVHARGLWHHTVHCWLVRPDDHGDKLSNRYSENKNGCRAKILFQQRSGHKDTHPGKFDITAAGHLIAGESQRDVVRELQEELGVQVSFEQLSEYGVIREKIAGTVGGVPYIDAEVSHVYGLVTTVEWMDFILQEEEVSGLYEADADALIALMEGSLKDLLIHGVSLQDGKLRTAETVITCSSFVPRDYSYYISVFQFLRSLAMH